MADFKRWAKDMNDEAIIEDLTQAGTRLEDYVLIGPDDARLSIFTGHPKRGLASLLVEEEDAHDAYVAFLKRRGARRYSTSKEFAAAIGWDGITRLGSADK